MADDQSADLRPKPQLPLLEDGKDFDDRYEWCLKEGFQGLHLVVIGRASRAPREPFAHQAEAALDHLTSKRVVIEFTNCSHISSAAFGFVVRFFRYATMRNCQVLAVAPNETVRGLMRVLGIDGFLLTVKDASMAEAFFVAQGI